MTDLANSNNQKPLKILMVGLGIFGDRVGGSTTYMNETARRLAARGHHVTVMTPRWQPGKRELLPASETIDGIEIHRYGGKGFSQLFAARSLFGQLVKAHGPYDVINGHFALSTIGILLHPLSRNSNVVTSFHGPWPDEWLTENTSASALKRLMIPAVQRTIEAYVLKHSNHVVLMSSAFQPIVTLRYGVPLKQQRVVPIGIDLERFHPVEEAYRLQLRLQLNLPNDQPLFFCVRRLVARMGLQNLIAAFRLVVDERPDATLVIGGKGPLAETLEDQIQSFNLPDNVRLAGYIRDEDLPSYYQAADAFVLPTTALEGFGIITVESLACGTPVLATKVGGSVDVLHQLSPDCLIEVESPEDYPEALAHAMLQFLNQRNIYPSREACRSYAESNFNWEPIISQLESIFRQG